MVPADIADRLDFASVDVSFISLTKILIPARNLLKDDGQMVCLIKPQFEAGKDKVGKKGVVREESVHREVIAKILDFAQLVGFDVLGLTYSPIKGPEGNIEYLVYIQKNAGVSAQMAELTEREAEEMLSEIEKEGGRLSAQEESKALISQIVNLAHHSLESKG